VIEASELADFFHKLISMYVEAESFESGEPLISLVQWHWQVFEKTNWMKILKSIS